MSDATGFVVFVATLTIGIVGTWWAWFAPGMPLNDREDG
jgi:hypothetical protein